jgi:DNA-binding CsgD family transcriptional regulator
MKAKGRRAVVLKTQERKFLRLVCSDIRYCDIAEIMGKSPRTIDGYRDDLFIKLRVRSRTGLVLWSLKFEVVKLKDIKI